VIIRRSNDMEAIRAMDRLCLPGCGFYEGDFWWIVYDEKRPVGYAGMAYSHQWTDVMYLCRAGIIPEYRGRGLQKRLIRVRVNLARKMGMVAVVTETRRNPASANNLISCGFKMYEPRNPWSFSDACYWMMKFK
jgi:GNAT superfamily N-acetyltransferase